MDNEFYGEPPKSADSPNRTSLIGLKRQSKSTGGQIQPVYIDQARVVNETKRTHGQHFVVNMTQAHHLSSFTNDEYSKTLPVQHDPVLEKSRQIPVNGQINIDTSNEHSSNVSSTLQNQHQTRNVKNSNSRSSTVENHVIGYERMPSANTLTSQGGIVAQMEYQTIPQNINYSNDPSDMPSTDLKNQNTGESQNLQRVKSSVASQNQEYTTKQQQEQAVDQSRRRISSPDMVFLKGDSPMKPPYLIPDEQFKRIQEDFYIMQKIGKHDLHQSGKRFHFDMHDQIKLQMVLLSEVLGQKNPMLAKELEQSYKSYSNQKAKLVDQRYHSPRRKQIHSNHQNELQLNINQIKQQIDSANQSPQNSSAHLQPCNSRFRNESNSSKEQRLQDEVASQKSIKSGTSRKELYSKQQKTQQMQPIEKKKPCLNSIRKELTAGLFSNQDSGKAKGRLSKIILSRNATSNNQNAFGSPVITSKQQTLSFENLGFEYGDTYSKKSPRIRSIKGQRRSSRFHREALTLAQSYQSKTINKIMPQTIDAEVRDLYRTKQSFYSKKRSSSKMGTPSIHSRPGGCSRPSENNQNTFYNSPRKKQTLLARSSQQSGSISSQNTKKRGSSSRQNQAREDKIDGRPSSSSLMEHLKSAKEIVQCTKMFNELMKKNRAHILYQNGKIFSRNLKKRGATATLKAASRQYVLRNVSQNADAQTLYSARRGDVGLIEPKRNKIIQIDLEEALGGEQDELQNLDEMTSYGPITNLPKPSSLKRVFSDNQGIFSKKQQLATILNQNNNLLSLDSDKMRIVDEQHRYQIKSQLKDLNQKTSQKANNQFRTQQSIKHSKKNELVTILRKDTDYDDYNPNQLLSNQITNQLVLQKSQTCMIGKFGRNRDSNNSTAEAYDQLNEQICQIPSQINNKLHLQKEKNSLNRQKRTQMGNIQSLRMQNSQMQLSKKAQINQVRCKNKQKYNKLLSSMKNIQDQPQHLQKGDLKKKKFIHAASVTQIINNCDKVNSGSQLRQLVAPAEQSNEIELGKMMVIKPHVNNFKVQIPINRHQNLIFKNSEERLNVSMTAQRQDKGKVDLKYKLNVLKKIDSEKPKLEAIRDSLQDRGVFNLSKTGSPVSNKYLNQYTFTSNSPIKNGQIEQKYSLDRATSSNPYDQIDLNFTRDGKYIRAKYFNAFNTQGHGNRQQYQQISGVSTSMMVAQEQRQTDSALRKAIQSIDKAIQISSQTHSRSQHKVHSQKQLSKNQHNSQQLNRQKQLQQAVLHQKLNQRKLVQRNQQKFNSLKLNRSLNQSKATQIAMVNYLNDSNDQQGKKTTLGPLSSNIQGNAPNSTNLLGILKQQQKSSKGLLGSLSVKNIAESPLDNLQEEYDILKNNFDKTNTIELLQPQIQQPQKLGSHIVVPQTRFSSLYRVGKDYIRNRETTSSQKQLIAQLKGKDEMKFNKGDGSKLVKPDIFKQHFDEITSQYFGAHFDDPLLPSTKEQAPESLPPYLPTTDPLSETPNHQPHAEQQSYSQDEIAL